MKAYAETGRFVRAVRRTAGTRPMALMYRHIQEPIDRLVYRLSSGRTTASSYLASVELTILTTTGAKTGRQRTHPVLGLPDGDRIIVIASNWGRPHHPAWYHNLRAHPRASIVRNGVSREVEARELEGEERERCYQRGIEFYPPFIHYRRWAGERRIPVLALEPR
jgi:deazaflavin-dependent oxidoreductase (nitroreductase family)